MTRHDKEVMLGTVDDQRQNSDQDEPPVRAFWQQLDMLRRERGLSYKQLERRAGTAASTLQYWMTRSARLVAWVQVRAVVRALEEPEELWFDRWKWADRESTRTDRARPDVEARPATGTVIARSQLPMDIREFTARKAELRQMYDALSTATSQMAVPIVVITGMAGVGKTRLAIHVAHQLKERFRFGDVQLYADLRGHCPEQEPAGPTAVLAAFLNLLGVPAAEIPHDMAARAALYRDRLEGERAIVLLDNAASEEQVRPLLPGSSTCRVLITSRRKLAGLEGVQPLTVKEFAEDEAVAQLAEVIGADRVAAEPQVAAEIVQRCGYLPLAVALAARRLRARPAWTLADFARRLRANACSLGELEVSDRGVRTMFGLSYEQIPVAHRRTFRFLALHPGDDFTPHTTAALTGTTPEAAENVLEALLDEHLVDQSTAGRYKFHDLVRTYAWERVGEEVSARQADAVHRLQTWYLYAADRANRLLDPKFRGVPLDPADEPQWTPEFATHQEALDWCDAEHRNVVAAVGQGIEHGLDDMAWRLAATMSYYFKLRTLWADWIKTYKAAVDAARRAKSGLGEARLLDGLAMAYCDVGRFAESIACFHESLAIYHRLGDQLGAAETTGHLGDAFRQAGRHDDAVDAIQRSLATFQKLADQRNQVVGLNNLGRAYRALDRPEDALECHLRAWHLRGQEGIDHYTEATILNDLGESYETLGHADQAVNCYRETLHRRRELGDRRGEAETLQNLGRTQGDTVSDCYEQASQIHRELDDRRARAQSLDV